MNTHEITLDVSKEPSHEPTLYIGQGDMNGTTLVANLFDNGEVLDLTGLSVKFCMRTPDMLDYYEVAGTASGNVATFQIDETYAAGHPGNTDIAYVQVIDGDTESTSTARMRVVVLPSAKEGVVPAPAYKSLIEEFLDEAQEEVDEIIDAAQQVLDDGIPLMTSTRRGGAKLGNGLNVDSNELLSVVPATSSAIGGVKPDGTSITIDADGTLHGASTYQLPTMGANVKGGAKLGSGLTVSDDVLSVDTSAVIARTEKGAVNGVASLDSSGLVPSGQLPSYVDDVIEGYYYNGAFYEESTHQTLITGETGKIYVDLTADSSYRWSGSAYISISNPIDIATETEARAGSDNTKMMTPLRVKQVVTGDIAPNSVTSSGEVTATETSGGTTSLHKLTEKADLTVVESRSKCWYGQCDTGESVAAKVVTCSGFELVKGAMIAVHFSYTNTASDATLNVNSTGAKYIATGNTISGQDNFWYAGEIMMFTYDGTYWRPANMAGINALRESVDKIGLLDGSIVKIGPLRIKNYENPKQRFNANSRSEVTFNISDMGISTCLYAIVYLRTNNDNYTHTGSLSFWNVSQSSTSVTAWAVNSSSSYADMFPNVLVIGMV